MSFATKALLRNIPQLSKLASSGTVQKNLFHTARALSVAQVQKPAPPFSGTAVVNNDFKEIKLADFKGKYLVLFFYPLDFTFVCPTEIIAFSDRIQDFHALNAEVVGVSVDSHFSHLAWCNTPRKSGGLGKLEYPLLADLTKKISADYGVLLQEAGISLRGLFIIDPPSGDVDPVIMDLSNHSTYARNKLEQLDEKLANKNQALDALKQSLKPDSKLLGILEKEIDWLKGEKRQLESHLLRTEVWGDYLGKWRAIVESVDFSDDKEPQPQFMIVVQVDEVNDCGKEDVSTAMDAADSISTGWVVVRSLAQFHDLHRKLRPVCAELKALDLPSNNAFKLFLLKNDKSLLEKAKQQIQKYLNFILEDDHLNQSEALYEFLSPSSDRLKQSTNPSPSKKDKSKFSLATLFKANSEKLDQFWGPHFRLHSADFADDDQVSMYLEGSSAENGSSKAATDADAKDSIAEPLYALLGEIFDMGGVFKWLRRSLISFVQITYGQTINRQIRESINYLFEEPMLHTYASTVLKALWPGGVLTVKSVDRSEDQQEMTMNAAKSLLLDNIPDLLGNLIGAQNARAGIMKLFDNVQNPVYNKQLFYDLLEILMLELFPEIRQLKVPPSVAAVAVVGGSSASTPTHGRSGTGASDFGLASSSHVTPTRIISRN